MGEKISRRNFFRIASIGIVGAAYGGLRLLEKLREDPRCDKEHRIKLEAGEYVLVDNWEITLVSLFNNYSLHHQDNAVLTIDDRKGISARETVSIPVGGYSFYDRDEQAYKTLRDRNPLWQGGEGVNNLTGEELARYSAEYDKLEERTSRRIIYRCDYDTFAFWNVEDFPKETPTPTQTQLPTITPTQKPAAIFP